MNERIPKNEIVELLFRDVDVFTLDELENMYPERGLHKSSEITRFGPSPTGFMHLGGIYISMINFAIATHSNGKFLLRIEDTDLKRSQKESEREILDSLLTFGMTPDEYSYVGDYGPYKQSERKFLYQSVVKELVEEGKAYPCFLTLEQIEDIKKVQESAEVPKGLYRDWSPWRNATPADVLAELKKGTPYTIRLKSTGLPENRVEVHDEIRGTISFPQPFMDNVLLKQDGLPTYHLAHVVDDHFMRTTTVVRGSEWLSSWPIHQELFNLLKWNPPKYIHISPISTPDGVKRKLSKRKDSELADIKHYLIEGYSPEAILRYLMRIASPNFENWEEENPGKGIWQFPFNTQDLEGGEGARLDINKLDDTSKEYLSRQKSGVLAEMLKSWSIQNYPELHYILNKYSESYITQILELARSRKDLSKWSDFGRSFDYFFDELYLPKDASSISKICQITEEDTKQIINKFLLSFDIKDNKETWFKKIKIIARELGYAESKAQIKESPEFFNRSIIELTKVLRIAITGREMSPDLYEIIKIMGNERVMKRLTSQA